MTDIKRLARPLIAFLLFVPAGWSLGAQIIIKGSMTHEKTALPGETFTGSFEIQNSDDKAQEVKIYQTDYLFYADGRVLYGDPGKIPRSNAGWISFSPKRLAIPPKDSVNVQYTVKVPDNKALAGTYWSIFMVEGIPEDSPESSTGDRTRVSMGVQQVFRYGIQVVTNIGDAGTRNLKFLSTKLVKKGVIQALELTAENTGERWLRSASWVELYDTGGNYFGKYEGERLRLYPGTSVKYTIDLSSVPNNTYKALVVIDCGGSDIFGANFNLVIK